MKGKTKKKRVKKDSKPLKTSSEPTNPPPTPPGNKG